MKATLNLGREIKLGLIHSSGMNMHCSVENHSILVAKTIIYCEVENCEAEVLLLSAKDILDFIGEIL